jgi:hypothetical protein
MPSPLQHPAGKMLASRSSSLKVTPMPSTKNTSRRRPVAARNKTRTADAAAPTSSILLPLRLHEHKPLTQQHQRKRMSLPRVPLRAHTTTPHTQPGTQRTPVFAAGARGQGLHQWQSHPRHRDRCCKGCTNTSRTHNKTTSSVGHRPAFPCMRTPQARTHSRAQHVLQRLQLGQVDQACTNGSRSRVTNTVVVKAAQTQATHVQQLQRKHMPSPRVPV